MISSESLARFATCAQKPAKPETVGSFDMEEYLAKHGFEVKRRKPWNSNPGGMIFELARCPFNADHVGGSAAFTLVGGRPGFECKHDGCRGKTIKNVFSRYPCKSAETTPGEGADSETATDRPRATQSQLLIALAEDAELFHNPEGDAFASLPVGGHREVWPRSENRRKRCLRPWRK